MRLKYSSKTIFLLRTCIGRGLTTNLGVPVICQGAFLCVSSFPLFVYSAPSSGKILR